MKYPKRSQYKHVKSQYRVRNWPEYETGLRRRGDLTVWLSDEALDAWRETPSGKPGGQRTYADIAIGTQVPALLKQIADPIASVLADGRYGCSFHLAVTPSSTRSLRPHSKRGIATFARSGTSVDAIGIPVQATARAVW